MLHNFIFLNEFALLIICLLPYLSLKCNFDLVIWGHQARSLQRKVGLYFKVRLRRHVCSVKEAFFPGNQWCFFLLLRCKPQRKELHALCIALLLQYRHNSQIKSLFFKALLYYFLIIIILKHCLVLLTDDYTGYISWHKSFCWFTKMYQCHIL